MSSRGFPYGRSNVRENMVQPVTGVQISGKNQENLNWTGKTLGLSDLKKNTIRKFKKINKFTRFFP